MVHQKWLLSWIPTRFLRVSFLGTFFDLSYHWLILSENISFLICMHFNHHFTKMVRSCFFYFRNISRIKKVTVAIFKSSVQFLYTKVLSFTNTFLTVHLCLYSVFVCVNVCVTTHSAISSTGQDPQVMDFTIQLQATRLTLVNGQFSQMNLTSPVDVHWC